MFCPKCGTELSEGDVFCYKCGTPMRKKVDSDNNATGNNEPANPVDNIQNAVDNKIEKGSAKKKKIGSVPFIICLLVLAVFGGIMAYKIIKAESWAKSQNNSESKEEIKVITVSVGNHKITIPEGYTLSQSPSSGVAVFNDSNNNGISITVIENATEINKNYIKQHSDTLADRYYKNMGLNPKKNGGSSKHDFTTGEFEGIRVNYYAADQDLRQMFILSNDTDLCVISLFGMPNDRDIVDIISVK